MTTDGTVPGDLDLPGAPASRAYMETELSDHWGISFPYNGKVPWDILMASDSIQGDVGPPEGLGQ